MRIDDGLAELCPGGDNDVFGSDGRAGDGTVWCGRLTTAETLVLGVLVAHRQLGADHTTLSRNLWVKPQLDSLSIRDLVTWTFDEQGDFRVIATDRLMTGANALGVSARRSSTSPASAIDVLPGITETQGAGA